MYARMLGISRRLAATPRPGSRRPRLPGDRAPGALSRPVQLPLLAWCFRRALSAASAERDLSQPDHRPQCPRRRRGPSPGLGSRSRSATSISTRARRSSLENDRLIAMVRPAQGGHIYELDVRQCATTCSPPCTAARKPIIEAIREPPRRIASGRAGDGAEPVFHEPIRLKQQGLDRLLVYDRHPRKALVDHFYPIDVTLDDLAACRDVERGDFVTGTYLARVQRDPARAAVVMERPGPCRRPYGADQEDRACWPAAGTCVEVHYVLLDLPPDERACILRSRSIWPPWPAMPTTATIPMPRARGSACSMPASTWPIPRELRIDRRMAGSDGRPELVATGAASGAIRSRPSARARAASRAYTSPRPSFPTGT